MMERKTLSQNKAIMMVLAFAFLVRLIAFLSVADQQMFLDPDSKDYLHLSDSISTSFEYSLNSEPEIFRAPGYPLFLAFYRVFFDSIQMFLFDVS